MSFARQTTFWDYAEAQWPGEGWLPPPSESTPLQPDAPTAVPACADERPACGLVPESRGAWPSVVRGRKAGSTGRSGGLDAQRRAVRGSVSYHAGRVAEAAVARHYQSLGRPVLAERWRCPYGEIDLIARDGEDLVFIEVKQGPSHDAAILHLTQRQMARIVAAASVYLGGQPLGQATPVRFDVVTVDGAGRIDIREAAFC